MLNEDIYKMAATKEKKIVIKAINDLGRRVSAADVAARTGLPVASVTWILNQIAAEAAGHLQVSTAGDIAYQFPIGYQTAYISRGIKQLIEQFGQKLFQVVFFLVRISFGVMLILSLLTIALLLIVIVTVNSRSNDRNGGFRVRLGFFDWIILRDLLSWQAYYPPATDHGTGKIKKPAKGNFLYNCFSFLFGDGNPNVNLEERRWHAIAELIRQKQGVVTAEQLAPYTGSEPSNEDAVLPVLVRFDGRPTVTESGNIVYLFPALQATTMEKQPDKLPPYLELFSWQFSQVEIESLIWVILLAVINFFGAWYLYIEAARYSYLSHLLPLLAGLVLYGSLFVIIPAIRYGVIVILNKRIDEGNRLKEHYFAQVKEPDQKLITKLAEAQKMLLGSRQIKAEDIIYDTQKDALEQEFRTLNNA